MALAMFAYVIAIKEGLLQIKNIKTKKYANGKSYFEISVFRKGYTQLQSIIKNMQDFITHIQNLLLQNCFKLNDSKLYNGFVQ